MAFGIIFLALGIAVAWTTYAYALVSRIESLCLSNLVTT